MATRDVRREEFTSSNIVRNVRPNRPLSPPQKHTEFDNNLGEFDTSNTFILNNLMQQPFSFRLHRPFAGWFADKRIQNRAAFECIEKKRRSILVAFEFNDRRTRAFGQSRSEFRLINCVFNSVSGNRLQLFVAGWTQSLQDIAIWIFDLEKW